MEMSEEAIDLNEVLERVQDDKVLLLELLDIFQEDYVQKRSVIKNSLTQKDSEQIKAIAHSLKGASGNISAKKLHVSFMKLEQMAQKNDFAPMHSLVSEIDRQFSELQVFAKKLNVDFKKV